MMILDTLRATLQSLETVQSFSTHLRQFLHADTTGKAVSHEFLQFYVFSLLTLGLTVGVLIKTVGRKGLGSFLRDSVSVPVRRIARTAKEIERKTFHAAGLFVPLVYQFLLGYGWTQTECSTLCWTLTITCWSLDLGRLYVPFIRKNWPMAHILREHEETQLLGSCYFSLGCTLAINLFSPSVACASICYLVVGDMCAALFGVAFGGEIAAVKMGRHGKKSMEGSLAMFLSCIVVGVFLFAQEPLSEYPIVISSFVATIVELWEPFAVNDNLSIPLFTGLALHMGFARMEAYCTMIQGNA